MEDIVCEIFDQVESYIKHFINIEELVTWASMIYEDLGQKGYFNIMDNILIKNILLRIRDINDDLGEEEYDRIKVREYYEAEFEEICEYLKGTRNFTTLFKVQEDLTEKFIGKFSTIDMCYKTLIDKRPLTSDIIKFLKQEKMNNFPNTRDNIIYYEAIHVILNINEAISKSMDKIRVNGFGFSDCKFDLNSEIALLQRLMDVIRGTKPYRLNISIQRDKTKYLSIFY